MFPLPVGTPVCVRDTLHGRWNGGFEVAETLPFGYRLHRVSDGRVFEQVFAFDEVVVERRRDPLRGLGHSYLDRRRLR